MDEKLKYNRGKLGLTIFFKLIFILCFKNHIALLVHVHVTLLMLDTIDFSDCVSIHI